jgi:hypothetical protein
MAVWGRKYMPVSEELSIRAQVLEEGGPALWRDFAEELRELHLGKTSSKKRRGPSVMARLQAAYDEVVARKKAASG